MNYNDFKSTPPAILDFSVVARTVNGASKIIIVMVSLMFLILPVNLHVCLLPRGLKTVEMKGNDND